MEIYIIRNKFIEYYILLKNIYFLLVKALFENLGESKLGEKIKEKVIWIIYLIRMR